ncbi:sulfur carrier protein ThiS [Pontibacter sp. JAM-7]|uniref:sulfur carrier protein ThiS n=1 Tax=Pontibacter sp. JAM-7 TaxID=3366581 RepID=UPI003AF6A148
MQIELNGDQMQVTDGLMLSGLVKQLGLAEKRIAVELNLEIIPRSQHVTTALHDGDKVEIVHAIGGG